MQTQTCPHVCTLAQAPVKAMTSFSCLRGRMKGLSQPLRQPGTSGVTFCPLLLGALVPVICGWADTRHQAGCRAELSLTFVELGLVAKEAFFPLFCPRPLYGPGN